MASSSNSVRCPHCNSHNVDIDPRLDEIQCWECYNKYGGDGRYHLYTPQRIIPSDVIIALQNSRLIEAIKAWRAFTGCGLLCAKVFIEQNRAAILTRGASAQPSSRSESAKTMTELPKQDLLCKLLKMTTSDNDGEALSAIRKANNLLSSAGWDWDKLISGKITVVADPFASVGTPPSANTDPFGNAPTQPRSRPAPPQRPMPSPPPRPQAPPRPTPAPQAAQPQRAKSIQPYSTRTNNYGGWCYCCGIQVPGLAGFIIKPKDEHVALPSNAMTTKWQIICAPCNKTRAFICPSPARRQHASTSPTGTPDLYTL